MNSLSTTQAVDHYSQLHNLGSASLYIDEIFAIDHVKLFEDFNRNEIEALSRFMNCYAAPSGFRLLNEGDEGDFLILVLTGKVAVLKRVAELAQLEPGANRRLTIAEPGMTLGEMSLIDGIPRFASCDTIVPVDFAVLSRASLRTILVQMPRLGNKLLLVLLQLMASRLRDTSDLLMLQNSPKPEV